MSQHEAKPNDKVVIFIQDFWGGERFGITHAVDKVYKNGNVTLKSYGKQFKQSPTSDGYRLRECSGSVTLLSLTKDVQLRIEKSKLVGELTSTFYAFEEAMRKYKKFSHELTAEEIKKINQDLIAATNLIKGESQ